ncbi:DNA segregation ATPase FtsK/SpoIIIE, S-DNA-T family [Pasteurella skyensis]|uniref:DNA translocase FtsK n=2 Tax=Phocoenobacter skyensis TaxID=97481 RepID=A0A1H7WIS4_9PAST|nr:DNA segregation ATPase FtsK/SpoIIIE, S-DNA-T family [Pasteurella skyensis]
MTKGLKGKDKLIQLLLIMMVVVGCYLMMAWISYSPLDNSWSVSSSVTTEVLNKAGVLGAWTIDLLFSAFGQVAFIIPLVLIISPLYWLFFNLEHKFSWLYLFAKFISFILLLLGLSGCLSMLFSYSEYYVSGGFVGNIFINELSAHIETFGALVIAAIFAVVGFYFCLGKILFSLGTELYSWLTTTEEKQAVTSNNNFAKNKEDVLTEQTEDINSSDEETTLQPQLTDVTRFTRPMPKIIGLKRERAQGDESQEDDKTAVFNTATAVQQQSNFLNSVEPVEQELEKEVNDLTSFKFNELPKVHLDPEDEENATESTSATIKEEKETVDTTPAVKVDSSVPKYPKGYGNTLIHPLLQQHTKMPKPKTPLPTINLMEKPPVETQRITKKEIYDISTRIETALADFGVKATVEDVLIGPVVTRYEIQLAAGIKSSKVINLGSDLARALMFKAIRITDVVPGKPYMGIETPNSHRETVWLRDILESKEFSHSTAKLPMALGKDISGQSVVVDMAKMPHLLVAGQTGGGKSVGVNTMILSLLYKLTPEQVRFIMIDPKVVELSIYDNIPHLLTPVVTDMKKAVNSLRWVVDEMERRYMLLKHLSVRNIEGYNDKIEQAEAMNYPIPDPTWKPGDSMDSLPPALEKLSYIVVIIDEFSDLIMTQGKQVEEYIIRIGQKARAAGIHLILATQRPSADVITGLIKSNIPSRIAFTVASQIDSRTILDKGGAESLLGRGDMLYSAAGSPDIIRVHGAFMHDEDVQKVTDDWRARGFPNYIDAVVSSAEGEDSSSSGESGGDLDPLFDEVVAFVLESNVTSASGVQRRFSIGFPRAARILDQLQEQGILSTPDNRGKREIVG